MIQKNLVNENTLNDYPFYVYSKEVKGSRINKSEITRNIDKKKFLNVINSLLGIGKIKYLEELELKENCKEWITTTLSNFPEIDDKYMEFLIKDFTDSMYTRMREEEKYVVAIIMKDSLILCHSLFGEKTITPNLQVIERMLDKDNVIRYVYFKKEKDKIKAIFYEETKSVFFVEWLGLPEKEAFFYFGGKNRIFAEAYGSHLVFEFTDEDFEKKVLEEKALKIEGNQIIFPEPIQRLPISQVRVGKKPYKNVEDFIQDFLAKRYDLNYYQEEYKKLRSSLIPLTEKLIDNEHEVRSESKIYLKKRNPNFIVLFCDKNIEIRRSFLDKIKTKILNRENIRLFHAGMELNPTPLAIKNIQIFNKVSNNLTNFLIDYYNSLSIRDIFDIILLYTIFELLSKTNSDKPISYFFRELKNSLIREIDFSSHFLNKEDEALELKSRDFVAGNDKEIIKRLKNDIEKKMKEHSFKVYIIGADEKTKKIEPMPSSRFDDSRLQNLEVKLQKELGHIKLNVIRIPSKDGTNCILIGYVLQEGI